jgi:hypothetical protein
MITMRRRLGRTLVLGSIGGSCAIGAGCTFINSYADLEAQKVGGPDGSTDSSVGDDSRDAGNTGPDGAPRDSSTDTGISAIAAQHGVIVIGGEVSGDAGRQLVLTAIDPSTGSELPKARTPLNVAAVQYDGVNDVWYVFESGGAGIFPLPTDPFYLHTLTIDPISGVWTELGKFPIAPGVSFATTTVINERISYIAYGDGQIDGGVPDDGGAATSLVTLDTTDPKAVTVLGDPIPLTGAYGALIGARSDFNAAGGFLALGSIGKPSPEAGTVTELTTYLVPGSGPPAPETTVFGVPSGTAASFGTASTGSITQDLALTRVTGVLCGPAPQKACATLAVFDPTASDPTTAFLGAGVFPFADGTPKPPAFSPCAQMAFVVGTNSDLAVHAVYIQPIGPGDGTGAGFPLLPSAQAATGHSGQGVYFEPYTNTVITPFSQGDNFALTAFTLTGTQMAPQLVQRQPPMWVPPPDLRPNFVATKSPFPFVCPVQGDN